MPTITRAVMAAVLAAGASLGARGVADRPDEGVRPSQGDTIVYRSTAEDRRSVTITVYNQNFGLVREVRDVDFTRGIAPLEFAEVAQHIQPETVHIRAEAGGLQVLEQNYQYDLLDPQKLLEKYVGRTVTIYRHDPETRREEPVQAEVISVNGGPILRIGDEITFNYGGRFSFPGIPDNLIARPTLQWLLDSERDRHALEVSYLTGNLNWKADYVFVIDEGVATGDLTGWVTLTNQSGASYENARLKLVAGEVQRVTHDVAGRMRYEAGLDMAAQEAAAPFTEESFFEYHLYTLDRPTTLRQNEQKQVTLLEAAGIGLRKRLQFYGAAQYYRGQFGEIQSNRKLDVFLEFENTEENGLGMPLPKGVVRVYQADASGAQQFIGEDAIDHTPRDERLRIRMGEAFDVVGDRRQMAWRPLGGCVSESDWRINVRNHKDERIEVDLIEPIGGDWQITSTTHAYERLDAHTFRYRLPIVANGEIEVRYTARVRWC